MEEKKKVIKVKVNKPTSSTKNTSTPIINTEQIKKHIAGEKANSTQKSSSTTDFVLVDEGETEHYEKQPNNQSAAELIPQTLCPRCGSPLNSSVSFCPTCGQAVNQPVICPKCGQELSSDMQFCPNCGTATGKPNSTNNTFAATLLGNPNLKKYLLAIIAIVAAIVLIFFVTRNTGPSKLEKAYEDAGGYAMSSYVTLIDDGKSLSVDTNPNDLDDFTSSEAAGALRDINSSLGLPDALMEKFFASRAIDGTQTVTYDDISVTWKYHPDQGLEVIYEIVDKN